MKKLVAFLLAGVMVFGCVACGNNAGEEETEPAVEAADATELLTKAWDTYGEDEKFFAMGGHFEAPVDNAPGNYDLSKAEDLTISFCIPTEAIEMVDNAATLMHAMNANNFSAAAYHVVDPANKQFIIDVIKDKTLNNQWMCGFPEKLAIVTVGDDYVVTAFGTTELVDNFTTKLTNVYGNNVIISVEEDLAR